MFDSYKYTNLLMLLDEWQQKYDKNKGIKKAIAKHQIEKIKEELKKFVKEED